MNEAVTRRTVTTNMANIELSPFACTLSEALQHNLKQGSKTTSTVDGLIEENDLYKDIDGFIKYLASHFGNQLAVGCVTPTAQSGQIESAKDNSELFTFEEIERLSSATCAYFRAHLPGVSPTSRWVALIATSSPVFLLSWLGLIRAGLKVLLIAPQSSPQAIQHLIHLCQANLVIHDARYRKTVETALKDFKQESSSNAGPKEDDVSPQSFEIPWTTVEDLSISTSSGGSKSGSQNDCVSSNASDVAYSFHSSGTTGLPKLIPQTHHGAVGVLPLLQQLSDNNHPSAGTFTTTPLYSGGIADIFRSWSAAAPLWLFPEGRLPITATNMLGCIDAIDVICEKSDGPTNTILQYLSCVPFVLESMLDYPKVLERLRKMKMIGVGGAAMPKVLGDELVSQDVNLVSRFGSSENGFLLSSNRDFENDKQWDVLRYRGPMSLEFKNLNEGDTRQELVVLSAWPLVSTAKHAKRPFNTHDLFVPHPSLSNAWYYEGRSDSQLTLRTGRKFDPTEMESLIRTNEHVGDIVVLGEGQNVPSAIVFLSEGTSTLDVSAQMNVIWPIVSQANEKVAKHARLDKQYLILLPHTDHGRLRKNNKGGVVRSSVATDFTAEISRLYNEHEAGDGVAVTTNTNFSSSSVLSIVQKVVQEQIKTDDDVGQDDDLFEAGLDSQGCISICRQIQVATGSKRLPLSIVYECGTIRRLAEYISEIVTAKQADRSLEDKNIARSSDMRRMVEEFVHIQPQLLERIATDLASLDGLCHTATADTPGNTFLVTGCTGFLGVHLLYRLLKDDTTSRIFVLIRGSRTAPDGEQRETAKARIQAGLSYHRLADPSIQDSLEEKVKYVPFFTKDDDLGIATRERNEIIASVTHVIHAAWEVNFNLSLRSFASHIKATVNLFNLAILANRMRPSRSIRFAFCSSVASIQNASSNESLTLDSEISNDPLHSSAIGYAESKWVTEQVLYQLAQKFTSVNLALLRVGQLSGDTVHGIWSHREAWPLMFDVSWHLLPRQAQTPDDQRSKSDERKLSIFPNLAIIQSSLIDWLPVDRAAELVLQFSESSEIGSNSNGNSPAQQCLIRSVCNSQSQTSWSHVQDHILKWASHNGYDITFKEPQEWLDDLESCERQHQAKALIPLWRANWISRSQEGVDDDEIPQQDRPVVAEKYNDRINLDGDYIAKVLTWVDAADRTGNM